jgi:hypothetical protein
MSITPPKPYPLCDHPAARHRRNLPAPPHVLFDAYPPMLQLRTVGQHDHTARAGVANAERELCGRSAPQHRKHAAKGRSRPARLACAMESTGDGQRENSSSGWGQANGRTRDLGRGASVRDRPSAEATRGLCGRMNRPRRSWSRARRLAD